MSTPDNEPLILALHRVPSTIRVELSPDEHFDLDVLTAQLKFESLASQPVPPTGLLPEIVNYIRDTYGHTLTVSQAWDLVVSTKAAFELHKKKLNDSLTSASGSRVSTLFESPASPTDWQNLTFSSENSPASSPSEPSTNSSSTPPAPPSK